MEFNPDCKTYGRDIVIEPLRYFEGIKKKSAGCLGFGRRITCLRVRWQWNTDGCYDLVGSEKCLSVTQEKLFYGHHSASANTLEV